MSVGVYIGMEMPKNCRECRFCNGQANTDYGVCAWCNVDGKARDAYAMKDCPLIPVQPHGRLIDADDIDSITVILREAGGAIKRIDAPTIIPASEEGEA